MEQRRRMRVECHLAASAEGPDRARIRGWVRNLSSGGMFVETAERLSVGTRCEIALLMRDGDAERATHAVGEIVRAEGDGMAVQFLTLDPGGESAVRRMLAEIPVAG